MIELKILSGKQAGATAVARRFPFLVGRAPDSAVRLEDEGGSEWDVMGRAIRGPRAGRSLEPAADSYLTVWIEWSLAHPGSEIVR